MVNPDDLLLICNAISIARSENDLIKYIDYIINFIRENMLYFELIDILRSPEIVKVMTGSWSDTFKKKLAIEEME